MSKKYSTNWTESSLFQAFGSWGAARNSGLRDGERKKMARGLTPPLIFLLLAVFRAAPH